MHPTSIKLQRLTRVPPALAEKALLDTLQEKPLRLDQLEHEIRAAFPRATYVTPYGVLEHALRQSNTAVLFVIIRDGQESITVKYQVTGVTVASETAATVEQQ